MDGLPGIETRLLPPSNARLSRHTTWTERFAEDPRKHTNGGHLPTYYSTPTPCHRPSGSHHPHRDTIVHPCIFIVPPSTSYYSRAAAGLLARDGLTAAGGRAEKEGKGEKSERVREYVTTHAIGLLHAHGPWPARLLPACLWSHHLDGAGRIHKIEAHARARRPLATANLRLLLLLPRRRIGVDLDLATAQQYAAVRAGIRFQFPAGPESVWQCEWSRCMSQLNVSSSKNLYMQFELYSAKVFPHIELKTRTLCHKSNLYNFYKCLASDKHDTTASNLI